MVIAAGALIDAADYPAPVPWTSAGLVAGTGITLANLEYMVDTWGNVRWRGGLWGTAPAANAIILTFPTSIQPTLRWINTVTGIGSATPGTAATTALIFGGVYGSASAALNQIGYRNMVSGSWPTSSSALALDFAPITWSTK